MATFTHSAMHEQQGTIQLFAVAKCQFLNKMDILQQQIAESYLLAHASLSTGILTQPMSMKQTTSQPMHVCPQGVKL